MDVLWLSGFWRRTTEVRSTTLPSEPSTSLDVVVSSLSAGLGPQAGATKVTVSEAGPEASVVEPPKRLTEIGRATHQDEGIIEWDTAISRSLVVNGSLFTVSDAGIEAEELANLRERSFLALH